MFVVVVLQVTQQQEEGNVTDAMAMTDDTDMGTDDHPNLSRPLDIGGNSPSVIAALYKMPASPLSNTRLGSQAVVEFYGEVRCRAVYSLRYNHTM